VPDSILDRKPLIYVWRPFYERVLAPVVWPWLGYSPQKTMARPLSIAPDPPADAPGSQSDAWQALHRIETRQLEILERLHSLEMRSAADWALVERIIVSFCTDSTIASAPMFEEPTSENGQ
jgi:hypothetical protein